MAMYARQRDVSLVNLLNRELMGNIITQQCAIYQYKLEETKVNIYGESSAEKFYNGPFLFNVCAVKSYLPISPTISRSDSAFLFIGQRVLQKISSWMGIDCFRFD